MKNLQRIEDALKQEFNDEPELTDSNVGVFTPVEVESSDINHFDVSQEKAREKIRKNKERKK